jgi:hypothetical protein
MRNLQKIATAKDGRSSSRDRQPAGKASTPSVKPKIDPTRTDVDPSGPPASREFVIRARHGSEVLFELRSRDPRDLLQVIWTKVRGIREIELTVEDVRGGRQATRDTVQLRRTRHLYEDLVAVSGKWQRGEFGAA